MLDIRNRWRKHRRQQRGTCGWNDIKETVVFGHVSHTDIHIKSGEVWTAACHRAEHRRYFEKYQNFLVGLRTYEEEATFKEERLKHIILVQWLSATPGLLFHACLLALSRYGRPERTAV